MEDGQALITRTRELADPFGIPTIHTNGEEFEQFGTKVFYGQNSKGVDKELDNLKLQRTVASKVQMLLSSSSFNDLSAGRKRIIGEAVRDSFEIFLTMDVNRKNQTCPIRDPAFGVFADKYLPGSYKEPILNNIFRAGEDKAFRYVNSADIASVVGADKFSNIWHEIAHGTGAGEPQAELMSAIVTRQTFSPSHVLKMAADERAITSILKFDNDLVRDVYGWGMVDANDYIGSRSDERILELKEVDIKALRFNRFDPLRDTVFKVGSSLLTIDKSQGQTVNLMAAAQEAEFLSETQFKDDDVAHYVCKRFALACTRTTLGYEVYGSVPEPTLPRGKYPSFIDEPEI